MGEHRLHGCPHASDDTHAELPIRAVGRSKVVIWNYFIRIWDEGLGSRWCDTLQFLVGSQVELEIFENVDEVLGR